MGVRMDVSDSASVREGTDAVVAELRGVDIWINNAGVFPSAPVLEMSDEQWDHVFAVNARGVRNGAREAARRMDNGGVVINVVSTAGFRGTAPGLSAYVASKHAVRGMTKQMALEFAPRGIRVLGVAPSYVPTEGNMAAAAAAMEKMAASGMDMSSVPEPDRTRRQTGRHRPGRAVLRQRSVAHHDGQHPAGRRRRDDLSRW